MRWAVAVTLLAVTACVPTDWTPVHSQAKAALDACAAQHRGQRLATIDCAAPKVRATYAAAGYPHMDLIDAQWVQLAAIAEKEDQGRVTPAEARGLIADLDMRIRSETSRRDDAVQLRRKAAFNNMADGPTLCVPSGNMLRCW
jgi:hypothetical protein